MPAPTVPWQVMTESPPRIRTNQQGTSVTCQLKIRWIHAFRFHDDVMGTYTTLPNGIVVTGDPWRFPGNTKLVATDCEIVPFAINPLFILGGPNKGLSAGEYWEWAKAIVTFGVPDFITDQDDPEGRMQFDPENPISWCVQDMDIGGEYRSTKLRYKWKSDNADVPFEIPKKCSTVEMRLKFPRVAYIPAEKIRSYQDNVNTHKVLGCPAGTLLFLGASTNQTATSAGLRDKSVVLNFKFSTHEWNKYDRNNGTLDKPVHPVSGAPVYAESDLRGLFR